MPRAPVVYHERQLGSLCGLHCINNLLQGPRFGPGDLAEIGARLDRREQRLMGGCFVDGSPGGENFDGSADGGNFSIQVLRVALARMGLKLLPAGHPESAERMRDPPRAAGAFVVQRSNHWLALRIVGPCWWDLDSLLGAPRALEDKALGASVGGFLAAGHSVFLVLGGSLPEPRPPGRGDPKESWHDLQELLGSEPSRFWSSAHTWGSELAEDEELGLEEFRQEEVRAAMALAGGCLHSAAEILRRARSSVAELLEAPPRQLAKALAAAVRAVLSARRSLPDAVAHLVALLCAPAPALLAGAAERVDCGELAHELLEALARKARGWLWSEGLETAATVAVDLLLALPASGAVEAVDTPPAIASVEGPPPSADRGDDGMDALLAMGDDEGRPLSGMRPLVSDPGLKAHSGSPSSTPGRSLGESPPARSSSARRRRSASRKR